MSTTTYAQTVVTVFVENSERPTTLITKMSTIAFPPLMVTYPVNAIASCPSPMVYFPAGTPLAASRSSCWWWIRDQTNQSRYRCRRSVCRSVGRSVGRSVDSSNTTAGDVFKKGGVRGRIKTKTILRTIIYRHLPVKVSVAVPSDPQGSFRIF